MSRALRAISRVTRIAAAVSALLAATVAIAPSALGHHSFPATYIEDGTARIEGRLVAFMFRNPHSYVHVNVTGEDGEVIRYAVEWGAAATLGRQGITRASLKPGDHVIVNGLPARNADEHRVLLRTIERPADGFRWGFDESETFN